MSLKIISRLLPSLAFACLAGQAVAQSSSVAGSSSSAAITVNQPADTTMAVNAANLSLQMSTIFVSNVAGTTRSYGVSHTNATLDSAYITTTNPRRLTVSLKTGASGVDTITLFDTLYTGTTVTETAQTSFVLTVSEATSSSSTVASSSSGVTITVAAPNDTTLNMNSANDTIVTTAVFTNPQGAYTRTYGVLHSNPALDSVFLLTGPRRLVIALKTDAIGVDTITLTDTLRTGTTVVATAEAKFVVTVVDPNTHTLSTASKIGSSVSILGDQIIAKRAANIQVIGFDGRIQLTRNLKTGERMSLPRGKNPCLVKVDGAPAILWK